MVDTGGGMTSAQCAMLFQKFSCVPTHGPTHVGAGLGLWLATRLTELMGGHVTCESVEGAGTRMSMQYPAVNVPPPVKPVPQKTADGSVAL